jgi:hypothetical protein
MRLQQPDGAIADVAKNDGGLAQILAATALAEAYSLTSSAMIKPAAEKALEAALALQREDGGWPRHGSLSPSDSWATLHGLVLLKTAESAEIDVSKEPWARLEPWTAAREKNLESLDIPALSACLLFSKFGRRNPADSRARRVADRLHEAQEKEGDRWDSADVYAAGFALWQMDGPRGPYWKSFNSRFKASLIKTQLSTAGACSRGMWPVASERERGFGATLTTSYTWHYFCFFYR